MREALERVKRELGPDAVILGTRCLPARGLGSLTGRQRVEVSAAPADAPFVAPRRKQLQPVGPPPAGARPTTEQLDAAGPSGRPPLPEHLYPYLVQLVQNEVAQELAESIVRDAAGHLLPDRQRDPDALRDAIRARIAELIPAPTDPEIQTPGLRRVAFVGPSGGGKTTTVAKLAAHFKLRHGRRVALLSLDTHRVAAAEQLRRYGSYIDVPVYVAQTSAEVRALAPEFARADSVLIDTPGIGLREHGRFARLGALLHAARVDEKQLVLPATLTPAVQVRIAESFAALRPARVVLTRLDEAVGFGVVLNTLRRVNMMLSYITTGQNVPHDIEVACGARLAALVLK